MATDLMEEAIRAAKYNVLLTGVIAGRKFLRFVWRTPNARITKWIDVDFIEKLSFFLRTRHSIDGKRTTLAYAGG